MERHLVTRIDEPSQIGEARRLASKMAEASGCDESETGKVAIIVNELGTNLLKHARGGEILLRTLNGNGSGIEIIALDQGAGIRNLQAALGDGYSTAGSPGTGLGAIQRLSDQFDIYSQPERGTALLARLWTVNRERSTRHEAFDIGGAMVAHPSENVCGDNWTARQDTSTERIMLADGLGHGLLAAEAAKAAVGVLEQAPTLVPDALLNRAHLALRATRGAVAAMAEINIATHTLNYCGIGNISASIHDGGAVRQLVSHNGTLGHELRKVQAFSYPWPSSAHRHLPLLVMHSDGLTNHWRLDQYAGLIEHQPSLIAAVLYRDFKRGRDDVTVIVAKENKA